MSDFEKGELRTKIQIPGKNTYYRIITIIINISKKYTLLLPTEKREKEPAPFVPSDQGKLKPKVLL